MSSNAAASAVHSGAVNDRTRCPLDLRMHRVTDCNASKPNLTPSPEVPQPE